MIKKFCQVKLIVFFMLLFVPLIFSQDVKIQYSVSMPMPSNHLFEVEMRLQNVKSDSTLDFVLPVWRSGRYVIFNFASGVQEFSANGSNGEKLKWQKTDKSTWRVKNNRNDIVKITYKVFANDFSLRTRGLNNEQGFIDASAVFMYVEKYRYIPIELKVIPFQGWHVTTGLDKLKENVYGAVSYDYFADCPLVIGTQKDFEFFVEGKKHIVSFTGEGNYNIDTIIKDLTKIVESHSDFWGGLPYNSFTFLFRLTIQDYGGTEHINSFIINAPPFLFNNKEKYLQFLSICSHEFFHTWNVKRLRPKGITPYNFTKENYIEELWISEGTTSYYQDLMLLKAGLGNEDTFLKNLENSIQNDIERPGNKIQSLAESSFDAWIKFWVNTPNKFDTESNYYDKGSNVSLLLDLEIRNNTSNKHSLDNVMRAMYQRYPLEKGGFTNADFIKVSEEFAGEDLSKFFASYLFGTDTLDWNKYLQFAGLQLNRIANEVKPRLGIKTSDNNGKLIINYVVPGLPAYEAGLDAGDEIIALNNYRVSSSSLSEKIADMHDGQSVIITIMRNDILKQIDVTLKNIPSYSYKITKVEDPTPLQKAIYENWLSTSW